MKLNFSSDEQCGRGSQLCRPDWSGALGPVQLPVRVLLLALHVRPVQNEQQITPTPPPTSSADCIYSLRNQDNCDQICKLTA